MGETLERLCLPSHGLVGGGASCRRDAEFQGKTMLANRGWDGPEPGRRQPGSFEGGLEALGACRLHISA